MHLLLSHRGEMNDKTAVAMCGSRCLHLLQPVFALEIVWLQQL